MFRKGSQLYATFILSHFIPNSNKESIRIITQLMIDENIILMKKLSFIENIPHGQTRGKDQPPQKTAIIQGYCQHPFDTGILVTQLVSAQTLKMDKN